MTWIVDVYTVPMAEVSLKKKVICESSNGSKRTKLQLHLSALINIVFMFINLSLLRFLSVCCRYRLTKEFRLSQAQGQKSNDLMRDALKQCVFVVANIPTKVPAHKLLSPMNVIAEKFLRKVKFIF